MTKTKNSLFNFPLRFFLYLNERFPLHQNGILILAFSFCAFQYSRMAFGRQEDSWPWFQWSMAFLTTFGFFFLLRLADEFKDAEEDARFRPYRPVPRGLISLKELAWLGSFLLLALTLIQWFFLRELMLYYFLFLIYWILMSFEFFVHKWLKQRHIVYLLSHMAVMPLIDLYSTSLDWARQETFPNLAVDLFLILSFFNGVVFELGRKIRAPQDEEEGVSTYSKLWGPQQASKVWAVVVTLSLILAVLCALFIPYTWILAVLLLLLYLPSLLILHSFKSDTKQTKKAKRIESYSGLWMLGMYIILGLVPVLLAWL